MSDKVFTDAELLLWIMAELERQERKGYLHGDLVAPLEAWRKSRGLA